MNTFGSAPQEWKDFYVRFEDLRRKILNKIFSLSEADKTYFLARIKQKESESFSTVEDPTKYLTYHKSIASSVGPIDAPNIDFDGEYSLMKFYENLEKEIFKT